MDKRSAQNIMNLPGTGLNSFSAPPSVVAPRKIILDRTKVQLEMEKACPKEFPLHSEAELRAILDEENKEWQKVDGELMAEREASSTTLLRIPESIDFHTYDIARNGLIYSPSASLSMRSHSPATNLIHNIEAWSKIRLYHLHQQFCEVVEFTFQMESWLCAGCLTPSTNVIVVCQTTSLWSHNLGYGMRNSSENIPPTILKRLTAGIQSHQTSKSNGPYCHILSEDTRGGPHTLPEKVREVRRAAFKKYQLRLIPVEEALGIFYKVLAPEKFAKSREQREFIVAGFTKYGLEYLPQLSEYQCHLFMARVKNKSVTNHKDEGDFGLAVETTFGNFAGGISAALS
ncbi:hypothetical protein NA56DRAFT_747095 [Hyaloscypha hepaticicola]|uniref:Uncharacterized protein n=1 Tax=Hyaloscypha hepaticicola TaxID=2082293 RepID=A0A2J6QAD8_9HELO|nr:hypothetical protein NA56DRAFT_747095 [Hyaloscypha hepaticicola]